MNTAQTVLEVIDLNIAFKTRDGDVYAVNGVSFSLAAGELLGVVGESGSGKSVTMMSLVNLLPYPPAKWLSGRVIFNGQDIHRLSPQRLRRLRGREIGFVFQDPMSSLNPVLTIGFQLMEPLRNHLGLSRFKARKRAEELLDLVGIADGSKRLRDYPHQFSGGMRQRVMIAMALACEPKVLIADEPTTALDVTIQAQILELIRDLRRQSGMAIIWVTHDLGVVANIADRVAVMYGGKIVEYAKVDQLFANPKHPYTQALLSTLPIIDGECALVRLRTIEGQPPKLTSKVGSCVFAPRCPLAFTTCLQRDPMRRMVGEDHEIACWREDVLNMPTLSDSALC